MFIFFDVMQQQNEMRISINKIQHWLQKPAKIYQKSQHIMPGVFYDGFIDTHGNCFFFLVLLHRKRLMKSLIGLTILKGRLLIEQLAGSHKTNDMCNIKL